MSVTMDKLRLLVSPLVRRAENVLAGQVTSEPVVNAPDAR